MKKNFYERLSQQEAYEILRSVLKDRFYFCSGKASPSSKRRTTRLIESDNDRMWGFVDNEDKYLNVFLEDKKTGFITSAAMKDDGLVVFGYNDITFSNFYQLDYKRAMFKHFGNGYKRYLQKEVEKQLEFVAEK